MSIENRTVKPRRAVIPATALALAMLAGSAATLGSASPTAAQAGAPALAGAKARVSPAAVDAVVAEEFSVSVTVDDVADLAAFQFTLQYDEDFLTYGGVEIGPFLGSTGREVQPAGVVTGTGTVTFGAYSEPGAPGPSGGGVIAVVTMGAKIEGDTYLRLEEVLLADSANEEIEVGETSGAIVTIYAEAPLGHEIWLPYASRE